MLNDLRKYLIKRQREYRRQERIRTLQEQSEVEQGSCELKLPARPTPAKGVAANER